MTLETSLTRADARPVAMPKPALAGWSRHWPILLGALTLVVPTMSAVARESWSTEQGAHGPIVLATALWLLWRQSGEAALVARAGSPRLVFGLLISALLLYIAARITGILEIEGPAMYFVLLSVLYALIGGTAMRLLWFPLAYLLFVFPPPDQMMAAITQPLKIELSRAAVQMLAATGMPIARTGVIIQVAQYDVLVAAACAGLNSIISLSAIGLFYIYVRHNAHWRYALLLVVAILPIAILSNFLRILLLILITYWLGDAVAQGFVHEFAGIFMFMVALGCIIGLDTLAAPLRGRMTAGEPA